MTTATLHMVHGFMGAGGTTFARELERKLPALRLTHDKWMLKLQGPDLSPELFRASFDRVSQRIETVWIRCVAPGPDVVPDLNFWSRAQRDAVRSTAATLGADTLLYRLSCPDEGAWTRIERRNRSLTDSPFIARDTFLSLHGQFQPLDGDEPRLDVSR